MWGEGTLVAFFLMSRQLLRRRHEELERQHLKGATWREICRLSARVGALLLPCKPLQKHTQHMQRQLLAQRLRGTLGRRH